MRPAQLSGAEAGLQTPWHDVTFQKPTNGRVPSLRGDATDSAD